MEVKLRPYQMAAADNTVDAVTKGDDPLIALPTGSGKTYTIAAIITQLQKLGIKQFLVLTHVKEIIQQNHDSLERAMNTAIGVYSAGLERKQVLDITVGGIQSVYRKPELFRHFKVVIIDEAHLINPDNDTMYQKFLAHLPDATRIGLTATPFRLGDGYIYGEGCIFNKLSYDCTTGTEFDKLITDKYLCPVISDPANKRMITEGVGKVAGDFNEKQLAAKNDIEEITNECIREILDKARDRKKWLIFAIDIDHAEHIAEGLIRCGVRTMVVHSKMDMDRDRILRNYKDGNYRCVVNVNILTTGFDAPDIDFIGLLRPTESPVLHVQTIGRGMRIHPGKRDCLVLDFAGNIGRLGPINNVTVHKAARSGKKINNICPQCEAEVESGLKECPYCCALMQPMIECFGCGFEVSTRTKTCPKCKARLIYTKELSGNSSAMNPISRYTSVGWLPVDSVEYYANRKQFGPDSAQVEYSCGGVKIKEWVCVEHDNGTIPKHRADEWTQQAGGITCTSVDMFIDNKHKFIKPRKILVDMSGKYKVVKERLY